MTVQVKKEIYQTEQSGCLEEQVCKIGAELYWQGFLLVQGHAYNEFTNNRTNIPKKIQCLWYSDRRSFVFTSSEHIKRTEGFIGFADESVQPTNPKPRARIRMKTMFQNVGIPYPNAEDFGKQRTLNPSDITAIRLTYQVSPGKLEIFVGETFDTLGIALGVDED